MRPRSAPIVVVIIGWNSPRNEAAFCSHCCYNATDLLFILDNELGQVITYIYHPVIDETVIKVRELPMKYVL